MFAHASEWERASGVCRNFTEQQHNIQVPDLKPMNLSSILVRTQKIHRQKNYPVEKFPGRKIFFVRRSRRRHDSNDMFVYIVTSIFQTTWSWGERNILMTSFERASEEKPPLCYVIENNKRTTCSASQYHSSKRFFKTWKNGAIGWGYLRKICSVWVRVKRRVLSGMSKFSISSMKNDRTTPLSIQAGVGYGENLCKISVKYSPA